MADNGSGGMGVLGVLVGALIVLVIGAGILFATGNLGGGGSNTADVKIETPKIETPAPSNPAPKK